MKFRLIALAVTATILAGCSSTPENSNPLPPVNPYQPRDGKRESVRELRAAASELYKSGRVYLDAGDYTNALLRYDQLITRYPFTDYATQAELERIFAWHLGFEPEKAQAAADRFLREHPRHPAADYVHYLRGVIEMNRQTSLGDVLGLDASKEDISYARRAFDDFALLVQKYPQSPYNGDARQRMIYLRNLMAEHDMHIVRYYIKRGAQLAAVKRAEQIVQQYPGAPSTVAALELMEKACRELGLIQQADDAAVLLKAQRAAIEAAAAAESAASEQKAAPKPPVASSVSPALVVASAEPEEKGFFSRLFSKEGLGDEPVTVIIPSLSSEPAQAEKSATTAATPSAAAEATAKTDAATPAKSSGGTRLKVYMEPYDDAPAPAAK